MERVAKDSGKRRAQTVEYWYRHHYRMPSSDPRFLDTTVEEMLTDYWAHEYLTNAKAHQDEVEDDEFDLAAELARIEQEESGQENGDELPDMGDIAPDPDDWEDLE